MDGQLGFDGEHSLAPCLIKNFFEQEASSSSIKDSGRETRSDLKVRSWKRFLSVDFISQKPEAH